MRNATSRIFVAAILVYYEQVAELIKLLWNGGQLVR